MKPWEIVQQLHTTADPSEILKKLDKSDPFWVGASYAIDPFVGIIVRLPLRRDPPQYGDGINPITFEKLVQVILDGTVRGDDLVRGIEALSRYCREDEWVFWYKRILQGEMDIPLSLDLFNQFCPEDYAIPLPALSKPKPINARQDLPERFFIQPAYPADKVFWLIDSTHTPIEIRCYDSEIRRVRNSQVEECLLEFARKQPVDIVLFGYQGKVFIADDILTREQFTKESGAHPLHRRLLGLAKLEIPAVQMSSLMTPSRVDQFYSELNLIFEQGFEGAIIRDLDAHYAWRVQPDVMIKPTTKTTLMCSEVLPGVGIKAEAVRGKKQIRATIRLGLNTGVWKDISELSPIGRRLDVLSCGQKDGELLLPKFQQWRS